MALAGLAVAACASIQGVAEFEAYRSAFEKNYATAGAILDQLAIQERKRFLSYQTARDAARFNPDLARYYTDAADPPGTAAFRRALETVKTYNDLLYGLASGQTAEALTAKAAALGSKLAAATGEVGGLIGGRVNGASIVAASSLSVALTEIQPFVHTALTLRSREEFRVYLVQYYPPVRAILLELRSGTTAIFPVLAADTLDRARKSPTGGSRDDLDKINTYRKLLADWVILIDGSIKALDQVHAAISAGPTLTSVIDGLTATTVELETTSQAARKHLAELATK